MKAKKIIIITLVVIVILAIGGLGGYFLGQNHKNQEVDKAKQATQNAMAKDIAKAKEDTKKAAPLTPPKTMTETTCNADELSLASSVSDAAAGTVSYDITFTNTGKRACTLGGFPGVSLVNDNGNQIGSPAQRATNYIEKKLTLTPNQKVKAVVSVANDGNFDPGVCKEGATKLRVYPPSDTGYLSVATDIDAWCPGFEISPVLAI
jgi:hypothetical protein